MKVRIEKVRIEIETEFGWGEKRSQELCTVERRAIDASEEDFGLSIAVGKSLLKQTQRALLQDQNEEVSEVARGLIPRYFPLPSDTCIGR